MDETDQQRYTALEQRYKAGDAGVLTAMYKLLYERALKTINATANKDGKVRGLPADDRRQKAHDAATYIIEQYCRRHDFSLNKNVGGYVYKRVQWALYGEHQNKRDQIVIYTNTLPEVQQQKVYRYIVTDIDNGAVESYGSAAELYENSKFKNLRKKKLVDCIRTGHRWKHYKFELLEL